MFFFDKKKLKMSTTISIFCLIESKFHDLKTGIEYGDAVFKMGCKIMKSSNGKYFIIHVKDHIWNSANHSMKIILCIWLESLPLLK